MSVKRFSSRKAAAAVVVTALLALTGCSGGSAASSDERAGARPTGGSNSDGTGASDGADDGVSSARVTFSPANAAKGVRPDAKIAVSVQDGTLADVSVVDAKGNAVKGELNDDGTAWTAASGLAFARDYTATVRAQDEDGRVTTATSTFTTLAPKGELKTSISPLSGSVVGVGMPIVVNFTEDVKDRAAVERRLKVTSSKPVEGAWHWFSDSQVHYRPKTYWPANTDVKLDVDIARVDAGGGVWGRKGRTVEFSTADAQVSVVDAKALTMTVKRNGKVVRKLPITTGKDGFRTRGGIKVISEKHERKIMDASTIGISPGDSEYYRLDVPYALRVTWSGEFIHAAEWSVGRQGVENVSHGCVGMSMSNGKWFYEFSRVGDPVEFVNSSRELEPNNGWTDWNVSWEDWKAGSAL